ncbi:protein of unknown function [Chitinophaga sp. YR573]|uniref:DUF4266 domain-containing protein n=1 Tax=Chitinophaga sp. YR573 TaxID=1881040 RepID=UPI0008B6CC1D|nr:DUF4266 domain-containing protein [Chitinophaga sp. YR573]SEW19165.1 protein of unknown function [Chitinophaga sp. YR573]
MQKDKSGILIIILVVLLLQACATVKPYQRQYLNDANMQLGKTGIEKLDESAQSYREGSSGGGTGKGSGGCGCN